MLKLALKFGRKIYSHTLQSKRKDEKNLDQRIDGGDNRLVRQAERPGVCRHTEYQNGKMGPLRVAGWVGRPFL